MPWLAATAFLHSVMIQEKRGMLKVWNMVLVSLAFLPLDLRDVPHALRRRSTRSTRSRRARSAAGSSASSSSCTVFTVGLIYFRLPLLRARTKLESLVSREATFLYNNLLLVALCLTILWGVVYPLLTQAVRGETRSVSKPYYDFFLHSFGLPLLLLMGIGPLVAWRRASLRALGKTFLIPLAASRSSTGGVLLGARLRLARGRACSRTRSPRSSPRRSCSSSCAARRATGSLFRLDRQEPPPLRRLHRPRGDPAARDRHRRLERVPDRARARPAGRASRCELAGYTLTYERSQTRQDRERAVETRAVVDVSRGSSHVATLHPGQELLSRSSSPQTSNEVSIYHDPRNLGDLFLIADQIDKNGTLYLKVLVKPLVNLIWAAGFLFLFGSLVAMWPDAVEQRRLAERYAAAPGMTLALVLGAVLALVGRRLRRAAVPARARARERPCSTSRASSSGGGSSSSRSATARSRR